MFMSERWTILVQDIDPFDIVVDLQRRSSIVDIWEDFHLYSKKDRRKCHKGNASRRRTVPLISGKSVHLLIQPRVGLKRKKVLVLSCHWNVSSNICPAGNWYSQFFPNDPRWEHRQIHPVIPLRSLRKSEYSSMCSKVDLHGWTRVSTVMFSDLSSLKRCTSHELYSQDCVSLSRFFLMHQAAMSLPQSWYIWIDGWMMRQRFTIFELYYIAILRNLVFCIEVRIQWRLRKRICAEWSRTATVMCVVLFCESWLWLYTQPDEKSRPLLFCLFCTFRSWHYFLVELTFVKLHFG